MKTKLNSTFKKLSLFLLSLMMIISFGSCAKKIAFQTSSVVPAARGEVTVKKDNNKNYLIQINIANLAEVNRLESSKNVYVVWMESDESNVKNIGKIKSDSKFLSSKLKASFETVTVFKPSKIFITAEDDAEVQNPSNQVVLSTNKF